MSPFTEARMVELDKAEERGTEPPCRDLVRLRDLAYWQYEIAVLKYEAASIALLEAMGVNAWGELEQSS